MILHLKASPNAQKSEVLGWEKDPVLGSRSRFGLVGQIGDCLHGIIGHPIVELAEQSLI